jgi:DNA-binding MarR family transcriptional regulator
LIDHVAIALAALAKAKPQQYRAVAWLIEHPGAQQDALAEALGCSQQDVSKLLARGLQNLEELNTRIARSFASKQP